MDKKRLEILDLIQGIAMVLVVLGHHLFYYAPDWYKKFHFYLYTFHMPLFIYVSGFLIRYSYKDLKSFKDYIIYIKKKVIKFTIPYIAIGCNVAFLHNSFSDWNSIFKDIGYLLYSPKQGPAIFLWYIYLLLFFYIISPFIISLNNKLKLSILFFSIIGYLYPIPIQYFCLDYFSKYFIFYYLGLLTVEHIKVIREIKIIYYIVFVFVFAISSFIQFKIGYTKFNTFMLAFFSIPSIYFIARGIKYTKYIKQIIIIISKNCFFIYLFHMFFVQIFSYLYLYFNIYKFIPYILFLITSSILSIYFSYLLSLKYHKIKRSN